jgi:small subunit ribosomal protein S16
MLAIRMQRTGRKGHANFRVVVQDSHQTPTSGKFVAMLGSYDPHAKTATIAKDKAEHYLKNGAQPSERVARLLKQEGVKLPEWVKTSGKKEGKLRNPEKLRRNRPTEEIVAEEAPATVAEEESALVAEETVETPAEAPEASAKETSAEPVPEEKPAE